MGKSTLVRSGDNKTNDSFKGKTKKSNLIEIPNHSLELLTEIDDIL